LSLLHSPYSGLGGLFGHVLRTPEHLATSMPHDQVLGMLRIAACYQNKRAN
jgi:hypothetical protein